MKCPVCGAVTRVIQTQPGRAADGAGTRRYRQCAGERRHGLITDEAVSYVVRSDDVQREQIADALAWGETHEEIARRLGVSPALISEVQDVVQRLRRLRISKPG